MGNIVILQSINASRNVIVFIIFLIFEFILLCIGNAHFFDDDTSNSRMKYFFLGIKQINRFYDAKEYIISFFYDGFFFLI